MDAVSVASSAEGSVLSRDWTVRLSDVSYATGEGKLLLEDVTCLIPGSTACAIVGPTVADKASLLRLLGGAARGGYLSGRILYGGERYEEAHLVTALVESVPLYDGLVTSIGGAAEGSGEAVLAPSEAVEFAAALRSGSLRAETRERWAATVRVLGLDEASREDAARRPDSSQPFRVGGRLAAPRAAGASSSLFIGGRRRQCSPAESVVARIACALVGSQPVVLVEDPFRGLDRKGCITVANAIGVLASRGHTVLASLDARALPDAAFDVFSRVVAMRDGRVLYSGETRKAAQHCAIYAPISPALSAASAAAVHLKDAATKYETEALTARRLDAIERCAVDAPSARACRAAYLRTPGARRQEHEAAQHAEPEEEDHAALLWLAPPFVSSLDRVGTLVRRGRRRCGAVGGLPLSMTVCPFLSERHLAAIAVAMLWGSIFWNASREGRDSLAFYDVQSLAFAAGQLVVVTQLAAAPAWCRDHAEFERERRLRLYTANEYVAARLVLSVLDSAWLALAPLALYFAAGMPVRFPCFALCYGVAVGLAVATRAMVDALAAYAHKPPPVDAHGGGGEGFVSDRAAAAHAERVVCGLYGGAVTLMTFSTGFGVWLSHLVRANPFRWIAWVNPLRWFVQAWVLRIYASPHAHVGRANLTGTGWARFSVADSFLMGLLPLTLAARLAQYYFLTRDQPRVRHVDAKKLLAWVVRAPPEDGEDDDEDPRVLDEKKRKTPSVATIKNPLLHHDKDDDNLKKKKPPHGGKNNLMTTAALDALESGIQAHQRDASRAAFASAIDAFPVSLAAQGVYLSPRVTAARQRRLVADVSLTVSARESVVVVCADDRDAPRCLLRALAGRDQRRFADEHVYSAGRVALNGSKRPRTFRHACAWLGPSDAHLDSLDSLSPRDIAHYTLHLNGGGGGGGGSSSSKKKKKSNRRRAATAVSDAARGDDDVDDDDEEERPLTTTSPSPEHDVDDGVSRSLASRTADGDFVAPADDGHRWVETCLDVADVDAAFRDEPLGVQGLLGRAGQTNKRALARRRVALACELVRAPVVIFADDVGAGACGVACGAREALAARDAAAMAFCYAQLAKLGCAVIASAHDPSRELVLAFDRLALLVKLGDGVYCRLATCGAPVDLLKTQRLVGANELGAAAARELQLRPLEVAAAAARLDYDRAPRPLDWPEDSAMRADGGDDDFAPSTMLDAAILSSSSSSSSSKKMSAPSFASEVWTLLAREVACARADKGALGASLGFPLTQALILGAALWDQGRDNVVTVMWLAYSLLALFVAQTTPRIARHVAVAHTWAAERAAGHVNSAAAFGLAQWVAPLPFDVLRALIVVPVVFAAARVRFDVYALSSAGAACVLAANAAHSIALAVTWLYAVPPGFYGVEAPKQARLKVRAISSAFDLAALLTLVAVLFAGFWRFVADLDRPWRNVSNYTFARWLLEAIAKPHMQNRPAPRAYHTHDAAAHFVGFQHDDGPSSPLVNVLIFGTAPLALLAALSLLGLRLRTTA